MMLYLGLLAGLLQLVGYLLYVRDEEIEPNPVTWLMFAYGTMLLTVLEWDRAGVGRGARASPRLQQHGALRGGPLLVACAPGGSLAVVAARMVARRLAGPRLLPGGPRPDGALPRGGRSSPTAGGSAKARAKRRSIVFLVGANLTTLTAFFPADPRRRRGSEPREDDALGGLGDRLRAARRHHLRDAGRDMVGADALPRAEHGAARIGGGAVAAVPARAAGAAAPGRRSRRPRQRSGAAPHGSDDRAEA